VNFFLPGLSPNHNHPNLSLPISKDYRRAPPVPSGSRSIPLAQQSQDKPGQKTQRFYFNLKEGKKN
jgi:hypothetical protein